MTCGIYMIQNLVNGKMYIGQSVDIERRWVEHKNGLRGNKNKPNEHLQNAWNKYGEDNFEFTIICECAESQLNTMEEYYIFELMSYDGRVGYNKTYGGEGGRPTEEARRKQSESLKGENNHFYGKHHSEETKRKQSEAHKGENNSMYGKHHSEETRRKQSEAHKGKNNGENNPMFGKHHSEETKEKMSESLKGRTLSEEHKIKLSKPIVQVAPSTNKVVNVWSSSIDAERTGGFNQSAIIQCCKGKRKTHGNYKWMYLKDWLKEHNKGIPKKLYFIE